MNLNHIILVDNLKTSNIASASYEKEIEANKDALAFYCIFKHSLPSFNLMNLKILLNLKISLFFK
jgi:hypothetical protein